MDTSNIPNDVLIFILSGVLGVLVGFFHARKGNVEKPIWPIKLYLMIIGNHVLTLRKYADSRNHFMFREQFMAAAFIWFFIIFVSLMFLFEGFRKY